MNVLKQLFDDSTDRGVSPVIGVILMVAITVILAAVIGTFVLNLSNQTGSTGPNAQMSVSDADTDYNSSTNTLEDFVTFSHNGGGEVEASEVRFVVREDSSNEVVLEWENDQLTLNENEWGTVSASNVSIQLNGNAMFANDTIGTGDAVTIAINDSETNHYPADNTDYRIQIIHPSSETQVVNSVVEVQ